MKLGRIAGALCVFAAAASAPLRAQERINLEAIHAIKTEAFQNSHVMDNEFYLTDVHGPRVTNSPQYFEAVDWAVKQLSEWGVKTHQEKWAFGRGWQFTHYSAHLIEPQYAPLIGFPLAWTKSTNGTVTGQPMWVEDLANDADLQKYKGQLKGKIVLIGRPRDLQMSFEPLGRRFTAAELQNLFVAPDPGIGGRGAFGAPPTQGGRGGNAGQANTPAGRGFQQRQRNFLAEEAPLVVAQPGTGRSEGGDVFGQAAGSRDPKDPEAPPTVALTPEHYNRIVRLVQHKIPVKLEFNIQTKFQDQQTDSVNIIGEIEGGRKKDEVVMLGAHFDSWQGGTGATDNAAGSAVMMEAMRILKTLNLKMDRTVRLGLWGGEEEGLLGSKAYVKEHFGDPQTMKLTADHAKLSGYFNIDNGTGKIRGVYLQGNDMMRPIFEQWFAPFKDLSDGTISIRNTGGTDHLSFDAVGLPGFQFIQDPLEYMSRTHHSNMDVYDRIQKGDMMQMSAIVAAFVYDAATRDDMLPRKALPKPQPTTPDGGRGGTAP
jgi:carboxypeptidase Q